MEQFETTLITGHNGSHKSTLLKQLVTSLVAPRKQDLFSERNRLLNPDAHQVFCLSGSAADRFPSKERPQGIRSEFDVPHYTYIGQRVGNNLLSRKAPLETMLAFSLHPRAEKRCGWSFFSDAHRHAGIIPASRYIVGFKSANRDTRASLENLEENLSAISPETDEVRYGRRPFPNVSFAMARWLLKEFSPEEFSNLRILLQQRARFDIGLSTQGAYCESTTPNVLRLGLLLDILRLQEVHVRSLLNDTEFSAFELSSGEYHMFSTILAIGFGLDEQSVLLMDEPENSLHPQWQRDLMDTVFSTCSKVMRDGHVIVSTHSPLIVGSASQGSTVVDMTLVEPQLSVVSYGASSDELLLNQFGVGSSRNKVVVDRVQLAVSLVERGAFDAPEFLALIPELINIRTALTEGDPMVEVIDALLGGVSNK
ncbi:ATP-binding protein [Hydrogenophaga flava]|uniref:ATP-binding protein n=1 Tax=Hydrogenophaga flava TaxID=65657 RepID=UPI001FE0BAEA|nr:ATP-binding protein [Hydrogenophaga flava]